MAIFTISPAPASPTTAFDVAHALIKPYPALLLSVFPGHLLSLCNIGSQLLQDLLLEHSVCLFYFLELFSWLVT